MRNEKNPDASRMVFPGMLDGVGINPIVAKRFGIQNESQLLDMASTGRELLREYNDALLCAGIAMSRAEIKTKNRIDLRGLCTYEKYKGKADEKNRIPDIDGKRLMSEFLYSNYWYCYIPCFSEGVLQLNTDRYVYWKVAKVDTCLIPELKSCVHFNQNNRYHKHDVYEHLLAVTDLCQTTKFEIKMAALLHDIGKPDSYMEDENGHGHFYGHPAVSAEIAKGVLKTDFKGLKTEEYDRIVALVKTHDKSISSSRKSVKRFIAAHGADFLDDWAVLKKADFDDHIFPSEPPKNWFTDIPDVLKIRDELVAEEECFSLKDLAVNGKDLMKELGLKPGKKIGAILQQMLEAVINETVTNNRDELLSLAQKLI